MSADAVDTSVRATWGQRVATGAGGTSRDGNGLPQDESGRKRDSSIRYSSPDRWYTLGATSTRDCYAVPGSVSERCTHPKGVLACSISSLFASYSSSYWVFPHTPWIPST